MKDVNPGPDGSGDWLGTPALVHNGVAYFPAHDREAGLEPWRSDGTPAGTFRLADVNPGGGAEHSYPKDFTALNGLVYFLAGDGPDRARLHRTDGTPGGTQPVPVDFGAGTDLTLSDLEAANGSLYFTATLDGRSSFYRSHGTAAGTVLLKEGLGASQLIAFGGKAYFSGRTGRIFTPEGSGPEPWETDGTPEGTRRLADLHPGPTGSNPGQFATNGTQLLFGADDGRHGREMWRLGEAGPAPQTPPAVVGRYVFYNNSAHDGAAAPFADDAAIATDKAALLPGGAASFANVTSYTKGVNGVMLDVRGLPAGAALAADDFEATVRPASVTVRRGAGVDGSDRVVLVWDDYDPGTMRPANDRVVVNGWLRVTVKANERTGLNQPDVFSFGNLVGDTGAGNAVRRSRLAAPVARVSSADAAAVKRAMRNPAYAVAPVISTADFNRDGAVNALDVATARAGVSRRLALRPPADAAAPGGLAAAARPGKARDLLLLSAR